MNVVSDALSVIRQKAPDFIPKIGIVLGSGLGEFADSLDDVISFSYESLPGFPKISVKGHGGNLLLGYINDIPVACLEGRSHRYEHNSYDGVLCYVRTLKALGAEYFLATNASGSLNESMAPGQLMMVTDHINFQPGNPLVGPNDDSFGPRFPAMTQAYHPQLTEYLKTEAKNLNINLHEGTYISVLGPCYETAAEIRFFKMIGADAVGMSTVPEVIVANHCGLKVAVIATITNYATGISGAVHDHDEVINMANFAQKNLQALVHAFIKQLP